MTWNVLRKARQYGIAYDNEELELGVRCMGSGIYDDQGKLVAQGPKSDFMKKPPTPAAPVPNNDPISSLEGRSDPAASEKFGYGAAA